MIHRGDRYPRGLHRGSRKQHALFKGDRLIYASPEAIRAGTKGWLDTYVKTEARTVLDSTALWFEVDVILPSGFTGSAAAGWTRTSDQIHLGLHWSENLTSWTAACSGWTAAPGSWPVTLGDGRKLWTCRYATPVYWMATMVDFRHTSDLHGKSITGISVLGTAVTTGMSYPYAMPADAARLQTDLRAAGYTGAVVSSTTGTLIATARNHISTSTSTLRVTMSGSNVTAVQYPDYSSIPAANFPYSMPSQKASLQADLRTAGATGAVVMLHSDQWQILIPNRNATGNVRSSVVTFSPGDPFAMYDMYGTYTGINPADTVAAAVENVRDPSGNPLAEALKGFARVGFIIG